MFVLMCFGSYLKNGRLIWKDKISTLKPPISPFETQINQTPFDVQKSWEACYLPHMIILVLSKLKVFSNNKIKVAQMLKFVFNRVQNICGKRRKCPLATFFSFSKSVYISLYFRVSEV